MPINIITSDTLCKYSLSTSPEPLQVTPAKGDTQYAILTFVISNDTGDDISISKLDFTFTGETEAARITDDYAAIRYTEWPDDSWSVINPSPAVFQFAPKDPPGTPIVISRQGIVIQFFHIPVNTTVGTATLTVTETAARGSDPATARTADFSFAKFPYGFYFNNFTANVPMVQEDHSVVLTWNGSDQATYKMFYDTDTAGEDVSGTRTWTSKKLKADTTFLLRATATTLGNEKITSDLSFTVIVANPEITATSINIKKTSYFEEDLTVDGSLMVKKDLNVLKKATLNDVVIQNTLNVDGLLTLKSPLVSGSTITATTLNITGYSNVGNTSFWGPIKTEGHVRMFGQGRHINPGYYKANSDGFIICQTQETNDYNNPSSFTVSVETDNLFSTITGGLMAIYEPGGFQKRAIRNALVVPVRTDRTVNIKVWRANGTQREHFSLVWLPLGPQNGSLDQIKLNETLVREEETNGGNGGTNLQEQQQKKIDSFVDTLASLFDEPVAEEKRNKLKAAAASLFNVGME